METRIVYLDGWRGLAIIAVLVGHFAPISGFNVARAGVELFFVLSGRLMAQILFEEEKGLYQFYIRRFSRIYPVVVVFVFVAYMAALLLKNSNFTVACLISALTMTYNYYVLSFPQAAVVSHLWSLCVEEHSYILLGIIASIYRLHRFNLVALLFSVTIVMMADGVVSTYVWQLDYYQTYWRSDVRGASIILGAALYLSTKNAIFPSYASPAAFIAGLALNLDVVPDPVKYSFGTALLAFSLMSVRCSWPPVLYVLRSQVVALIGVVSFSLYIWQQPFFVVKEKIHHGPLLLAAALMTGVLSFYVVERPARRWLNKHFVARGSTPPGHDATRPLQLQLERSASGLEGVGEGR